MKFEITKQQILELNNNSEKLKEWFPEAFENELEVGKWYIYEDGAIQFNKEDGNGYGINSIRKFFEDVGWLKYEDNGNFREATEEEVFEALKNEAIKRGFVGNKIKMIAGKVGEISEGELSSFDCYDDKEGLLMKSTEGDYYTVFLNGKWATIIETITKEEAEKLLNKKIID